MVKNMTEGNSLKLIVSYALPLLAGNLFQQLYNIVDAAIVGRYLGSRALAAVGASSSVQFLTLGFCMGICCGFGIPIAQKFGADDYRKMREYIFHSAVLTAIFAVILTLVCGVLCGGILDILSTPQNIYNNAYSYLFIMFMGIPFSLLYNLLAAILRAVGDSRTPFIFLTVSTVLNIALDLLCIVILGWGCAGAAIATVTAQGVSGILCLIVIMKKFEILHLHRDECHINGRDTGTMLVMGVPMGLQFSITAIGSMVMQSANNGLGDIYVSGFTAAARIKQLAMCPFDAIATAVSNFCSQNLGALKIDRIKKGLKQGLVIAVSYGIIIGIVLIFAGGLLSQIFIDGSETEVIAAAAKLLFCAGFFYWLLGFLNVCRLTIQGIGYSMLAIVSGVLEMIARVAVSMIFVPKYGYTAVCFTDQSAWFVAAAYCVPMSFYLINKVAKLKKPEAVTVEK